MPGQTPEPLSGQNIDSDETDKGAQKSKDLLRGKLIDNRDPYKDRAPEVAGLSYPVIFEPIQNVEFSISVYKVTTMVDFTHYVEYFRKYEQYLTKLYRDIRKEEKVKIITNPFAIIPIQTVITGLCPSV